MSRSDADGSTVEGLSATEAFATLANPTRLAILRTLWESPEEALPFSELRSRVGVADSGNFNHHINRLVGHFVRRTDGGYRLRAPGTRLVRAIIAGIVEDHRSFSPVEVDEACPFCGGPAELRYVDGQLVARCLVCDGSGTDEEGLPSGTFFRIDYPPSGLWNRSPTEILSTAYAFYDLKSLSMMANVCPECAGTIDTSVVACDEHDASDGTNCEHCGTSYGSWIDLVCQRCRYDRVVPARCRLFADPAALSFLYRPEEHPDDLSFSDWMTTFVCSERVSERVVSREPLRVRLVATFEEDEFRMTLDEQGAIVDRRSPYT